jgi:cobalt-zinc-cadmium efflux system membrane fusion protein
MRRIDMRSMAMGLILAVAVPTAAGEVVELDAAQLARAGVEVAPVVERGFGDRQRVVGQVVRIPGSTLTLKAVIGGRVEELRVAPGDRVRAGDVLVNLHSHELMGMQAELLRARDRARLAATRLEAGDELYAIEGISRLELQEREQEAFAAELEFTISRDELLDHGLPESVLETVLETRTTDAHLPVVAPIDGVLLRLEVEDQEWVEAFQTLVVMGDPERVELELQIAPDQASAVSAGDVVEFAPVGRSDEVGRAKVISNVPQVDPGTRTIKLRARIVESGSSLYPGVFVEGSLAHGEPRMAAAVPVSAVINVGGSDVVFVEVGEGSFELRPVVLGVFDGGVHEVIDGVAVGERIATGGVFLLKSTMLGGDGEGD